MGALNHRIFVGLLSQGGKLTRIEKLLPDEVIVGREPDSGVCIEHRSVSRRHATLRALGGGAGILLDCGSANGTFSGSMDLIGLDESPTQVISDLHIDTAAFIRFGSVGAVVSFDEREFESALASIEAETGPTPVLTSSPHTPPYAGNKPYAFVSYARRDAPWLMLRIGAMQAAGVRLWWDAAIVTGFEWPDAVATALSQSAAVLAIITPRSVASDMVRRELAYAVGVGIPVIPVMVGAVDLPAGTRLLLTGMQHTDLDFTDDWNPRLLEPLRRRGVVAV